MPVRRVRIPKHGVTSSVVQQTLGYRRSSCIRRAPSPGESSRWSRNPGSSSFEPHRHIFRPGRTRHDAIGGTFDRTRRVCAQVRARRDMQAPLRRHRRHAPGSLTSTWRSPACAEATRAWRHAGGWTRCGRDRPPVGVAHAAQYIAHLLSEYRPPRAATRAVARGLRSTRTGTPTSDAGVAGGTPSLSCVCLLRRFSPSFAR